VNIVERIRKFWLACYVLDLAESFFQRLCEFCERKLDYREDVYDININEKLVLLEV